METLAFEGTIEQEKELKAVFKKYENVREDLCLYFRTHKVFMVIFR